VWQKLVERLEDQDFTVIAVALDSEPGAPDPWIEAANPTYPVLIDRTHQLADLYGIVNVPTAIWIDEDGRIVRPSEVAGAYEAFRHVDAETRTVPEEHLEHSKQVRRTYLDAIADWVERGAESPHALSPDEARHRHLTVDPAIAEAHARFRLGRHLEATGHLDEARTQFDEASRLHPESWAIWRQTSNKLENGIAAGPAFSARVAALGPRHYYPPVEMTGMPELPDERS
jgi:hypothetical protein